MIRDKAKTNMQSRFGWLLFMSGFAGAQAWRFIAGPNLFAFLLTVATIAISFPLIIIPSIKQRPERLKLNRITLVGLAVGIVSMLAAMYYITAENSFPLAYLFISLGLAAVLGVAIRQLAMAAHQARSYYLALGLWLVGTLIFSGSYLAPADSWLRSLSSLSVVFQLIAVFIMIRNQNIARHEQQLRNQGQLDSTKADPFYGEQLKADKVKGP